LAFKAVQHGRFAVNRFSNQAELLGQVEYLVHSSTRQWPLVLLLCGLAASCNQEQSAGGSGGAGGGAIGGSIGSGGSGVGGAASGGSGAASASAGTGGGSGGSGGTIATGGSGGTIATGGAAGGVGASGPAGAGGAAGGPGSGGTAGGAAAGGSYGGAGGWSLGAASRCTGSPYVVCEDFESTAEGAIPGGNWSLPGTNYGVGTVVVASDYAARGSHSLKVTIPTGGSSAEHYLQLKNLGPLANGHFGRIFFRAQSPTTTPFVHWDLILGAGPYMGQNRRIRWGVTGSGVGTSSGNWSWIYNIEQGDTGTGSSVHPVANAWMCVEWQWDAANQMVRFYFDDAEVPAFHLDTKLPNGTALQVPTFSTLSFGLAKYQATNADLVFWIDEIALDTQRIGCAN
jgi:hypothetical protein